MILDARKNFRESDHSKVLFDAVASAWFQAGASAALITMQRNLSSPSDMGSAAANEFRLQGARQFLDIFMSLSDPETQRARLPSGNLNHTFK
jgi:hypothetical protein